MISLLTGSDMRKSLARLVEESPGREQIFARFGLMDSAADMHTLLETCTARGIDIQEVAYAVYEHEHALAKQLDIQERTNWCTVPLESLADHIERTYHVYMKSSGPLLLRLGHKVVAAHGADNPYLQEVLDLFASFVDLGLEVVDREATVFLPMVREASKSRGLHHAQMASLITVMKHEQEELTSLMYAIRFLTCGFTAPAAASEAWRSLFIGLEETQSHLCQYIHKERNILFPRCLN